MKSLWWKYGGRLTAVALVGLSAVVARGDDEVKQKPENQTFELEIDLDQDSAEVPPARIAVPGPGQRLFRARTTIKLSDFWLGLDCSPASPAMCSQLKLEEGTGIVIDNVLPESPAAKAGFKQHDILLSAGDQPLKDAEQLMKLLDDNKDKELTFKVLRSGDRITVAATPEKRPQQEGPPRDRLKWLAGDSEKVVEMLRDQLERSGVPLRMQFFHPGVVLPPGAPVTAFPDDLHVRIEKHGGKAAEIVVERDNKKWIVTEDKLGELPEDVRPHVESLLGRVPMPKFDVEIGDSPVAGAVPFNIPLPSPGEFSERVEKRLEEMSRRMEQLREQLNEIREQRRQNHEERRNEHKDDQKHEHTAQPEKT